MNVSQLTVAIAEGIMLYARAMDMPYGQMTTSKEYYEWEQWAQRHPRLAKMSQDEQFNLFDRMLTRQYDL